MSMYSVNLLPITRAANLFFSDSARFGFKFCQILPDRILGGRGVETAFFGRFIAFLLPNIFKISSSRPRTGKYVDKNFLSFGQLLKILPDSANMSEICQIMPGFSKFCQNARIFSALPGTSKFCQNGQIWQNILPVGSPGFFRLFDP